MAQRQMRLGAFRIAVVLIASFLIYFTAVVTLANVTASHAPAFALSVQPSHAVAHDRLADLMLAREPTRSRILAAADHAAAALRRNPTLPGPARILAMRAGLQGREAAAEGLFEYAAAMSRRDVSTQLWLLERRVAANDVNGALVHYGIILRVAPGMGEILFPVLTSALSQPHLVEPIARLVRDGGPWTNPFLYYVTEHAADPRDAAALYLALRSLGREIATDHLVPLITKLLTVGATNEAGRLYATVDRQWRLDDVNSQLNGSFERAGEFGPLAWAYNPDVGFRGTRPGSGDNFALHVTPPASGTAWAARRGLVLPQGTYRMNGRYGVQGRGLRGTLRISLACVPDDRSGAPVEIAVTEPQGRIEGALSTPAGCGVQLLTIAFESAAGNGADVDLWIDDLRLARTAG